VQNEIPEVQCSGVKREMIACFIQCILADVVCQVDKIDIGIVDFQKVFFLIRDGFINDQTYSHW
jgi:hypothetical protein